MSVPNAVKAREIAEKVKLEKKRRLEEKIDEDVQLLKQRAEDLVRSEEADAQNYWEFRVKLKEITFEPPQKVIEQFMRYMKSLGYVIPDIIFKQQWPKSRSYYTIRFRPREDEAEDGYLE